MDSAITAGDFLPFNVRRRSLSDSPRVTDNLIVFIGKAPEVAQESLF